TPLPSILLSNVHTLDNKIDHLQLELTSNRELGNCSARILTWLTSSIPDNAIRQEGLATFHADRNSCPEGTGYHLSVIPAYRPLLIRAKPTVRQA
ncbi:unnamed protein product, partial [Menidia menidia]